jgi:hypothetical protein
MGGRIFVAVSRREWIIMMWIIGAVLIIAGFVLAINGQTWGVLLIFAGLIVGPVPWYDDE